MFVAQFKSAVHRVAAPPAELSFIFRRTCLHLTLGLLLFSVQPSVVAADWETGAGYRRLKLEPVGLGQDGFTLLSPEQTGITFSNTLSRERGLASQILPSGAGV